MLAVIQIRKYFLFHRKSLDNITDGKPLWKTWATFNSILAQALTSSQDITVLSKDPFTQHFAQHWGQGWTNKGFVIRPSKWKSWGFAPLLVACVGRVMVALYCRCKYVHESLEPWGPLFILLECQACIPSISKITHYPLARTWAWFVDDADHYDCKNSHWWQISKKCAYDLGFIQI